MEEALLRITSSRKPSLKQQLDSADKIAATLQKLQTALQSALSAWLDHTNISENQQQKQQGNQSSCSAHWLLELCQSVPSELDALQIAQAIVEASHRNDSVQQEMALFETLGASEQAMAVLMEVAPRLTDISKYISTQDLIDCTSMLGNGNGIITTTTIVDMEEERRQYLLREAMDAAQVAAVAQAEVDEMLGTSYYTNGPATTAVTHTVVRTSHLQAKKFAEKATRRAAQAMQRAKDAGAIIDEKDLLNIDPTQLGDGGLLNRSKEELWALQQSLLPEGSRKYYDDKRGLPNGAIREESDDMEKVIIPAIQTDKGNQTRLKIVDIMDSHCAKAFEGTASLNPMQSATFDVAFHSRENMLVCAPTGAGKTNVAMLTTIAHFRDVGLVGNVATNALETGVKVVYIAPMKALAQEVVEKFASKLKPMRLVVRELTGDMQLTRAEADSANVIVTTPEKWDVVTRKGTTDENSLGNSVGLLIIDEVHLLADERGAVIESVVARLHRLVESRQRQVRIAALSATLPNYDDVANFLQVPERGVFYFGPEHRPVPLQQTFIGLNVNVKDRRLKEKRMNEVCYDVVVDSLKNGYQVMIFVHSRKGTGDTALALADIAVANDNALEHYFLTRGKDGPNGEAYVRYADRASKSRNRELGAHFANGMGIHHAGMLRGDRKLTEQMFSDGAIKVLCCTATLAWGINLPAHTVVIKGTEVYNPEKGGIVDLSILDVQQIFGRAGRPQFDTSGEATLITTNEAFPRYMDKLVRPIPIESNFIKQLADHLNAEVVGGTVTNLREAARWLTYTYLYVRMLRNPLAYGISSDKKSDDPLLRNKCLMLVTDAAKFLDSIKMLRFDIDTGNFGVVDSGRIAAHFYIQAESIATFNETLERCKAPRDGELCRLICSASEFRNMKLRQEEMDELQSIMKNSCPFKLTGVGGDGAGYSLITSEVDKAFVLLQAYISREKIRSFTLISDMNYIASNAGRVARGLFEVCLKLQKAGTATKLLRIAKSIDSQNWWFKTPLRHFESELKESVYSSIETGRVRGSGYDTFDTVLSLLEMLPEEVAQMCRCKRQDAIKIQRFIGMLPKFYVTCDVKPITAGVVKFQVHLTSDFEWHSRWHGGALSFWFWVEEGDKIYHHEQLSLSKRTYAQPRLIEFMIPIFGPSVEQYFIRIVADGWVGVEQILPVPLENIEMPKEISPHTDLLDLTPLPTTALNNPMYDHLYTKFKSFNPIQTQLFHVLYHTDSPVLLGAPTGSGKTIVAELAILRMKRIFPKGICVYIAPLKALARERLKEWETKFGSPPLNWSVLELSGDTHHDARALQQADVLVCTPEKWDLISRGWRKVSQNKDSFVFRVRLLIIDEAHLLGEDRGGCLEAIVSRTRLISRHVAIYCKDDGESHQENSVKELTRIVGLTTALANPIDLANWIGIETEKPGPRNRRGLYNFRPSVRPVPTTIHVQGYPGKHYCPRMATMNKPCFAAIKGLSPTKPSLIFVASRRQTRLTAFDIISYAANDDDPKMFLECSDAYVEAIAEGIKDEALRHTITFGIGLHHAGLAASDRDVVEKLFLKGELKILVATATLAWGVNLPAHLVIVKGTEYFDGKTSKYVDYPLTDVLQMIGRAGRPGFDTEAEAVVMVASDKKIFYKKFLYTPFPVESCLDQRINENINAEIATGTITNVTDGIGYMYWTFFARRLRRNPTYYGAKSGNDDDVEIFLTKFVEDTVIRLRESGCIEDLTADSSGFYSTILGTACSQFYLNYRSPKQMQFGLRECRKMITGSLFEKDKDAGQLSSSKSVQAMNFSPVIRSQKLDELSIAWLFYVLCSTHEFDELPVRHNEEFLNEELSGKLMWGADTAILMSNDDRKIHHDIEVFQDPHTKAFLLIQAYLEHATLPISDYVNDTKSVVENIPRLLAALTFIAVGDSNTANSFEVLTQLTRTRQHFAARTSVGEETIRQLPGWTENVSNRLKNTAEARLGSLHDLRSMNNNAVVKLLDKVSWGGHNRQAGSIEKAIEYLYNLPCFRLMDASVRIESEKSSGKVSGKLNIILEIDRRKSKAMKTGKDESLTVSLLLGSKVQRFLLANESINIANRFGTFIVEKELSFDWSDANADGEEEKGEIILRVLVEEIVGLDVEAFIPLK